MAGAQERTESATPRRRDEVRQRGQIARSTEINSAVALLGGFLFLRYWGSSVVTASFDLMHQSFENLRQPDLTSEAVMGATSTFGLLMAAMLAPIFLAMVLIGLVSNVGQVGFLLTFKPLQPDFKRLNPLEGAKRLVSKRSLVELIKALAKLVIVGYVIWMVLKSRIDSIVALPAMAWQNAVAEIIGMCFDVAIWAGAAMVTVAVLDYGYQRFSFNQSIRMSREEVKEEFKQTEGNPVIKQRVRQIQRAVAQRRMMQAVPQADVVITNPTHIAVALQYDPKSMRAPRVVAKGEGFIAEQIKRIARENGVATMENKPLARALFKACEIGQEIPGDMYSAVAELLAFVYKLRVGGARPVPAAAV